MSITTWTVIGCPNQLGWFSRCSRNGFGALRFVTFFVLSRDSVPVGIILRNTSIKESCDGEVFRHLFINVRCGCFLLLPLCAIDSKVARLTRLFAICFVVLLGIPCNVNHFLCQRPRFNIPRFERIIGIWICCKDGFKAVNTIFKVNVKLIKPVLVEFRGKKRRGFLHLSVPEW